MDVGTRCFYLDSERQQTMLADVRIKWEANGFPTSYRDITDLSPQELNQFLQSRNRERLVKICTVLVSLVQSLTTPDMMEVPDGKETEASANAAEQATQDPEVLQEGTQALDEG